MGQDWGWDRQVIPKRRQYIITARCVITQKSSVLCRYVALITLFVARRGISDRKTRLWTLPWQWWTPKHHHPFPVYERTPPPPTPPLTSRTPKGPFHKSLLLATALGWDWNKYVDDCVVTGTFSGYRPAGVQTPAGVSLLCSLPVLQSVLLCNT